MASREAGMTGMAGFRATMYNTFMRRNSIFVSTMLIGTYFMTNAFFSGTDSVWKSLNRGKSWEEVKARLPPKDEDDED